MIQIFGEAAYDYSGKSVSSAGDFNNDGYDDIIIGAYGADPDSRNNAGTSYLVFGKASGFTDIDLTTDLVANSVGFKVLISFSINMIPQFLLKSDILMYIGYEEINRICEFYR